MQEKQFDKIRGIFSTQKKHLIQIFKTILQIIKHLLKKNIINKIYTRDEEGNEYWNGKKIESKEATQEEIEELENLLKEFRD